jgi:chlorobactene glucosyltransferase
MIFLAYTSAIFLFVRLLVALANLISRPLLPRGHLQEHPLVSILIPARNEKDRLPFLLEDLYNSNYGNLEIIVYDDNSADGTTQIVKQFMGKDERIRLINGGPLPDGWLGKNFACHMLSQEAGGEYFLFLDADVRVTSDLLLDSISFLNRYQLELLSLFPVQVMRTLGEKVTVPLINWVLLSLLPLWLISRTRHNSLAAANGQFMLFKASTYRKHEFHQLVKGDRVEDIRIIRRMKSMGYHCQTLLSNGQASCRMYNNITESINGFSRNINAYFGYNWLLMFLFGVLTSFGFLFIWLVFPLWVLISYFAAAVLLRALVSILSHQDVPTNILLMPVQLFTFWIIMIRGGYKYIRGTMTWKGRPVS